jgi:hypothetical protein
MNPIGPLDREVDKIGLAAGAKLVEIDALVAVPLPILPILVLRPPIPPPIPDSLRPPIPPIPPIHSNTGIVPRKSAIRGFAIAQ